MTFGEPNLASHERSEVGSARYQIRQLVKRHTPSRSVLNFAVWCVYTHLRRLAIAGVFYRRGYSILTYVLHLVTLSVQEAPEESVSERGAISFDSTRSRDTHAIEFSITGDGATSFALMRFFIPRNLTQP